MRFRTVVSVSAAVLGLLAAAPPAAHAIRFGVEGAAGPAVPVGSYISSQGNEFSNTTGWNARVSLIMGSWFLGYEYTSLANSSVKCAQACGAPSGDFGTTKLHSFVANYHFYFIETPVRPYLLIGFGALFGTLGAWPTNDQQGNIFGADFRAGLGIEFPLGGNVFISLEGRYRFLLTNNPMGDLQASLVNMYFASGNASAGDLFKESIQKAHILQGILGMGFHF